MKLWPKAVESEKSKGKSGGLKSPRKGETWKVKRVKDKVESEK
jgi:hypothetical protein